MDVDSVYRAEYGRCVAALARLLGDIGLAEEAVQDAFAGDAHVIAISPGSSASNRSAISSTTRGSWVATVATSRSHG
jgi:hypothetical protein